jgi:hypothetical protein
MNAPLPHIPAYRHGYRRRRVDVAASIVAAILRGQGHRVATIARPGTPTAPRRDATPPAIAIEVAQLLPLPHVERAHRRVKRVEAEVRGILRPALIGVGGEVLLALAYSASNVVLVRRDRLAADIRVLASEVRQTLHGLVEGEPVQIHSPISWIVRADVTLMRGPRDGFHILQSADDAQPDLDEFVARTIAATAARGVADVSQAVLVVDARFPDADAVGAAISRSPVPAPWWRIYHVLGSDATLVFDRDE